jgi:glutathione synthase/RimK-type ligase-like ATP-grasp enzyme
MSPSPSNRITVVGNPDNRRFELFRAAVRAAGLPDPHVIAWRDIAAGASVALTEGSLVRLDSPGEDAEVDRLLRGAASPAAHGEIVGLAAWYGGFGRALRRIAALAAEAGATLLQDPDEILTMFDKRACHARLAAQGIPVPPALAGIQSYADLRAAMDSAGWHRVFVKPTHGSSASGVVALGIRDGRVRARTSVEVEGGRLFNSLRVREYRDPGRIKSIVDSFAHDGLHVERWFPKAGLGGRVVDLRVVVVAGRPTHAVVRSSRGPMTNLHLGGGRGDLCALRERAGDAYTEAMETCARVGAEFPGTLHVGVDLMFSPDWRHHAVAEVNAFGDLLPGLVVGGRDTYAEQVAALTCKEGHLPYAQWPISRPSLHEGAGAA